MSNYKPQEFSEMIGEDSMEVVKIENKNLEIKEWKGERVVTLWDISELHERRVDKTNELFKNNFNKFDKDVDYFMLSKEKFSETFSGVQKKIPNNVKFIPIFTESGYLKLVKPMTDDLSWKVQGILINSYFKIKELIENNFKVPKTFKEALLLAVEQQEEIERLELENKQKQEVIEVQQPKVEYYDKVTDTKKAIGMGEVAKLLKFKNYNNKHIGRNLLFEILRNECILDKYNQPYQKYVNQSHFEVRQSFNSYNGEPFYTTLVTSKGIDFILKTLRRLGYKEYGM